MCVFLLLNPSTHDAEVKNMTASRCESLAKHMYFNSMAIVNIFSLRSKTPEKLYYDPDPVGGAATDRMILWFADLARRSCEPGPIRPYLICGWGNHGKLAHRGRKVLELLERGHHRRFAFGITKEGQPIHPLRAKQNAVPNEYVELSSLFAPGQHPNRFMQDHP